MHSAVTDMRLTDTQIARSASRGAAATVTRTGFVMVLQTVSSLAIAHLIAPGSYGIFGLALTVIGFVRYVGDLGMTYRLEVLPQISNHDRGRALTVGLVTAAAGALMSSVTARTGATKRAPPGADCTSGRTCQTDEITIAPAAAVTRPTVSARPRSLSLICGNTSRR